MRLKKAIAVAGIGLSLTFALGACDTDDDDGVNGDVGDTTTIVDATTTTLLGDTTTAP